MKVLLQSHTAGMWKGQGRSSVCLTPEFRYEPVKSANPRAGHAGTWKGWPCLNGQDKVDQKIILVILLGVETGRRGGRTWVMTAAAGQGPIGL